VRIAVTGATGMVGRVVLQRFADRGDEVIAVGRDLRRLQESVMGRAACIESDYSRSSLKQAFQGVDVVVHLAARRVAPLSEGIRPFWKANVLSTENVVLAACDNHVDRLCQASSISVYSQANPIPFSEDQAPVPETLYGIAKLACEHLAFVYAQNHPIRITSLRISRILGEDRTASDRMLMSFVRKARAKHPLEIWGEGIGARDTIYVKDVVAAIDRAIAPGAPAGSFNIGSGKAFSNREIAECVNDVFDNRGHLAFVPSREEDKSISYMDCARAEEQLHWQRQWTLRTALEDMKKGYKASR
jgi:nucleoside-diphosphate-sugar epimerase